MARALDSLDKKILSAVQQDSSRSLDELAKELGVIKKEVAILDPESLGLKACFFVLVRTSQHEKDWQERFLSALASRPEIQEAHRLAGDIDYLLKVRVKDPADFDRFYQSLVSEISVFNITSLLSMQEILSTTALNIED
jgi:Lrp/AsnC family transcriptional regulator